MATATFQAYSVQVKSVEGWTHHSDHVSYRAAVDQADMVHGRVLCPTGETDEHAWEYAALHQGFAGDFGAWQAMDDDERSEYESGARGLPTA